MRTRIALSFLLLLVLGGSSAFGFCFEQAGETYQINPDLLQAIARVESNMDPSALNYNRNGSYDYGLMQINSRWYETLGGRWQYLSDPCYNVLIGSWILRQCMDRYGSTWDAVACYNTGKGLSQCSAPGRKRAEEYVNKIKDALGRQ